MSEKAEKVWPRMEIIIKKQIEILELGNIIGEMKKSFNELIHRQSQVEKEI